MTALPRNFLINSCSPGVTSGNENTLIRNSHRPFFKREEGYFWEDNSDIQGFSLTELTLSILQKPINI